MVRICPEHYLMILSFTCMKDYIDMNHITLFLVLPVIALQSAPSCLVQSRSHTPVLLSLCPYPFAPSVILTRSPTSQPISRKLSSPNPILFHDILSFSPSTPKAISQSSYSIIENAPGILEENASFVGLSPLASSSSLPCLSSASLNISLFRSHATSFPIPSTIIQLKTK